MAPEVLGLAMMKSMSAKDAKNSFGLLMDTARAEPVMIAKHGRPVVVVVSIEQFEELKGNQISRSAETSTPRKTKYVKK